MKLSYLQQVIIDFCRQSEADQAYKVACLVTDGRSITMSLNGSCWLRCAEREALKASRKSGVDAKLILVTRVTKQGRVTMARPCAECSKLLRRKHVGSVLYTDWEGEWCIFK